MLVSLIQSLLKSKKMLGLGSIHFSVFKMRKIPQKSLKILDVTQMRGQNTDND